MAVPSYTIRLMKKSEIPQALDIWKETGLQEGTKSVDTWFEIDPEGFWVAATEDTDEIIGVCSAVFHHEDLAVVGLYAVREKYRGHGIGAKLWRACYEHIGESNASVNAVPGKLEVYRDKGGFPVEETTWMSMATETDKDIDTAVLTKDVNGVEIRPIQENELPLVLEYDLSLMGYSREKAITLTIREEDSVSFVAIGDSKCVGYGVLKMGIQGQGLVGPLYADSQEIAEAILRRLIEAMPQAEGIAFMAVNANEGAKSIISKLGLEVHEECSRCYKNSKIDVDKSKVFGQLNLNFSPY